MQHVDTRKREMMRSRYWSHGKFAKWIINTFGGVQCLKSGTSEEWSAWRKEAKKAKFSYWFTEKFLSRLQNIVNWPNDKLTDIRHYLYNRFMSKSHYLRTGLEPGAYHGVDTRLLHGMFEELVTFIEVEKAWMMVVWNKETAKKYKAPYGLRWKEWRCPQAGLDHLAWEINLKHDDEWVDKGDPIYGQPTSQAIAAQAQLELYNWWKTIRPARPDPYDASGWSKYCDDMRKKRMVDGDDDILSFLSDRTDEEQAMSKCAATRCEEIEKQYDDEDTNMMCKLVQIRKSLWT
jgi:hypothetical protein